MKKEKKISILLTICFIISLISANTNLCVSASSKSSDYRDCIIVSLGDSYSSGEGIEPFFGQNSTIVKKVKNTDWLAHRSEKAWSGMLKISGIEGTMSQHRYSESNPDGNWYFVAASGATMENLYDYKIKISGEWEYHIQSDSVLKKGKKCIDTRQILEYTDAYGKNKTTTLNSQLEVFDMLKTNNKKADYITMTIGGNDMGFKDVITIACKHSSYLEPNYLADYLAVKVALAKNLEGEFSIKLRKTYNKICDLAGDQATLLVAGYPELFNELGTSIGCALISKKEANVINRSVISFDEIINSNIVECKKTNRNIKYVDVLPEFKNRGAYSESLNIMSYINFILPMQSQDIKVGAFSSYSMHPNYYGAKAYARCVQKAIDDCENKKNIQAVNLDNDNSWKDVYKQLVDNCNIAENEIADFYLADIIGDGVPELFVYIYDFETYIYDLDDPNRQYYGYSYINGELKELPYFYLGSHGAEQREYYNGDYVCRIDLGQGLSDCIFVEVSELSIDKATYCACYEIETGYFEHESCNTLKDLSEIKAKKYNKDYPVMYDSPQYFDYFSMDYNSDYYSVKNDLSSYGFELLADSHFKNDTNYLIGDTEELYWGIYDYSINTTDTDVKELNQRYDIKEIINAIENY